jgi:hypothetical protein
MGILSQNLHLTQPLSLASQPVFEGQVMLPYAYNKRKVAAVPPEMSKLGTAT